MSRPLPYRPAPAAEPATEAPAAPKQSFGWPGAAVVAAGAVLVVVGFTVLDWFSNVDVPPYFKGSYDFGAVRDGLDRASDFSSVLPGLSGHLSFGISVTYFDWLAWVLLAAGAVVGLLAVSPLGPSTAGLRGLGVLIGLLGAGCTFWALNLVSADATARQLIPAKQRGLLHYGFFLDHATLGAWTAAAGFLLLGIGAALGPRRP